MTLAHPWQAAAAAVRTEWLTARMRSCQRAAAWLGRPTRTARAAAAGIRVWPGERVLTLDQGSGGFLVAATAAAAYVGGQHERGRPWCRLGWEQVIRAAWDDRRGELALTGVGPGGVWRKELPLGHRRPLVDLAQERVTATLLAAATVRHGGQVCAMVMARRQPGSGNVIWVTLVNAAAGMDDQAIRAKAAATIADLRADTGIPAR